MSLGPEEVITGFCRGKMREIDHLEDASVDGSVLKLVFKKQNGMVWIRLIWLKIRTCCRHLKMLVSYVTGVLISL